jgi:hypothetical protein
LTGPFGAMIVGDGGPSKEGTVPDARPTDVSEAEWDLVRALRAIPEGSWRASATEILSEITRLLQEPRCSDSQADGVPCGEVDGRCDECERVRGLMGALVTRLRDAAHQGAGK